MNFRERMLPAVRGGGFESFAIVYSQRSGKEEMV